MLVLTNPIPDGRVEPCNRNGCRFLQSPFKHCRLKATVPFRAWSCRVKLGVDMRTGETVAVKIMYKDNMSARAAQQLRREITSMKALNHPNVLRLKDVHEVCADTTFRLSSGFDGKCLGRVWRRCTEGLAAMPAISHVPEIQRCISFRVSSSFPLKMNR